MLVPVALMAGKKLLGAVGRFAARRGIKTVGGAVASGAATVAVGAVITKYAAGPGIPTIPPGFGPQRPGAPPRPGTTVAGIPQTAGPIRRGIERIVPGGRTGREFTPVNDMTDKIGRPIAVYPMSRSSVVGPAGYVVVTMQTGEKVAMLRQFAIRAGLYKAQPKPPVSGWDMRAITRAASAAKRVKKLAQKVGWQVTRKGSARRAPCAPGKKR